MQVVEKMLQAEIEFWRFMIKNRTGTVPEKVTERMLYACALAEKKLMMMNKSSSDSELKQ